MYTLAKKLDMPRYPVYIHGTVETLEAARVWLIQDRNNVYFKNDLGVCSYSLRPDSDDDEAIFWGGNNCSF